jgi:hypothetical protein
LECRGFSASTVQLTGTGRGLSLAPKAALSLRIKAAVQPPAELQGS